MAENSRREGSLSEEWDVGSHSVSVSEGKRIKEQRFEAHFAPFICPWFVGGCCDFGKMALLFCLRFPWRKALSSVGSLFPCIVV